MPYGVQPSGKREQYQLHHVIFFIFTRGMWCDVTVYASLLRYRLQKKKGTQSVGKKWQNQRTMFVWYVVRRIWRRVKLSCFFAFMWGYASSLRLSHAIHKNKKTNVFEKKRPFLAGRGVGSRVAYATQIPGRPRSAQHFTTYLYTLLYTSKY